MIVQTEPGRQEALMDPQEVVLQVVMVDDEEALCQGVRRIIQKYDVHVPDVLVDARFEYCYFTSGEDFLVHLSEGGAVDLLLLDLKLPGVGGMDVLDALSDTGRDVLTIMVTAYATFETAVKATKLGAYDFLAKPFTPDELRYAVRKATSQLILSRQARKLAEEKRQVRFNFISVLAHELKAPLNAVEGYLNILATTESDQNLAMVERSIVRVDGMKKLISDLLDLTRIESGQRERVIRRLDLPELARGSIELFAADAARRGITVALETSDDVELLADAGEIEIVLNNLVSNAIKYNRDGGSVTVTLRGTDDGAEIVVADTGIGLRPEEAAKLFREFTRIKNEHTVKVLGSGLGLSTVRKIAMLYEGEARVASEAGAGSTFTVTLKDAAPVAASGGAPATGARGATGVTAGGGAAPAAGTAPD
jgi:signal transduction histidine kinase